MAMHTSGLDAALRGLERDFGNKYAQAAKAAPEKKAKAAPAEATFDVKAEGYEGCKLRVDEAEKKIKAKQAKIDALPPTKGNKPKIAELKKELEELQRDGDYRAALTVVRQREEEEREKRRGQRDLEEEQALMGGGIAKKQTTEAATTSSVRPSTNKTIEVAADVVDDASFEMDVEVVAIVNSAVEGSIDAQEKLSAGLGKTNYSTDVRQEAATMSKAMIDKLSISIKRAAHRDHALKTIRAMLWHPASILPMLPTVLSLLEETTLKLEPMKKANDLCGLMCQAGPNGKAMPAFVLPVLVAHVGAAANGKWKIKVGALDLLKSAMLRMRDDKICPLQLGHLMPEVTSMLRAAVGDARKEVKKAAEDVLACIAQQMVETPEVKGLASELIASIVDSANMQRATDVMQKLGNTTFMNTIDAASFALMFPIVTRAMRERDHEAKKKGVQIVGASVSLIASPEFLIAYLPELMPLLQECLLHPSYDVQREAAKAFGQLAAGLPALCRETIMPFLLQELTSKAVNEDVSEVNRRGAAHGLSEVLLKRPDLLIPTLYETILPRIKDGETAETKAGALVVFQFLPHLGAAIFLPHLVRALPVILAALQEESEVITKQAKRSAEILVEEYGASYPKLMLPYMQEALYFPREEAQDLSIALFFLLCDKVQDAVKFGQDFLTVGCLNTFQRHSLLSSIYIARTDPNPNIRRNATLLWKERVQSGPKAKSEILSTLLQFLKGLEQSGDPTRQACAKACLAELKASGDVTDDAFAAVEPIPFLTAEQFAAAQPPRDTSSKSDQVPQQTRSEMLRRHAAEFLPSVALPPPLRKYIEEVVLSCCIEGRNEAEARETTENELRPITPPKAANVLQYFGLDDFFTKAFDGVPELGHGTMEQRQGSGDALVYVNNLMLMYGGGHTLLKDTTLELLRGHRYGVVGRNGAGKTTLMTSLANGSVKNVPKTLKILHVKPEILMQVSDLTAVQFCLQQNSNSKADGAMEKALAEVGFPKEMQEKSVAELSGGWRMKLLIASAMMRECDLLLLDEPTNHLDTASVEWLSQYLRSLTRGTVMVISHDPNFLNTVCTDIIQYSNERTLEYYPGNFEDFRAARNITTDEAEALLLGQDVDDFQFKPPERVGGDDPAGDDDDDVGGIGLKAGLLDKAAKITFPIPGKLQGHSTGKPVLELKNVYFTYDDEGENYTLMDVNVKVGVTSRIGIVGQNGAGKSTLLSLLCGELQPSCGPGGKEPEEVYKHRNLRVAYISQDHMFHLNDFMNSSPYVYIQKRYQNGWDEALQQRLQNPGTEEEAVARKELALKYGKYGREVDKVIGRQIRGKEVLYEVQWMNLDDPKQNTYEPVSKLKKLGVLGYAKAYDERLAAQTAGIDQRPLSAKEIVKHFEQFGLEEELVMNRNIGTFSAGQRSKLTLGAAFWAKPHLVALDEPTNYIDMETLDSLAKGLNRFKGAVLVISHSNEFVERVCEETWLVADKRVTRQGKLKA